MNRFNCIELEDKPVQGHPYLIEEAVYLLIIGEKGYSDTPRFCKYQVSDDEDGRTSKFVFDTKWNHEKQSSEKYAIYPANSKQIIYCYGPVLLPSELSKLHSGGNIETP